MALSKPFTELIAGPAGRIEVAIHDPGDSRRGIALIAHPHPLMGGTNDNKVVTTLARTFHALAYVALRPNFRGVGATDGIHDEGRGEADDLVAVAQYAKQRYGELPLICAGFRSAVTCRYALRRNCIRKNWYWWRLRSVAS